ncbi:pilus assembly protein PilF [Candidatus Francisella endociliophora]|uniref:Pilus assembly protein PilF n=1 Tax=Candidatus Francisella endociliophora TaxID=653937 RepID=A0A097EM38_9GAMM|nr:pilus assembly protein PilF [Francisella sp. FSC1006]AIT08637.1 pilus assembly protein PilF [Francisella sp. FSC1006]
MPINLKKIIAITILSSGLSACMTPSNQQKPTSSQQNQNKNNEVVEGNVAKYTVSAEPELEQKADYRKATELTAELVIAYTTEGYLDRAKDRLIKAQNLAKEHGYNLAIVDYAAGYYYQMIGANSIAEKYYDNAVYYHPKDFEAMNFYAQYLCSQKYDFKKAQELFEKSMYMSSNNDMAQTLFLYSECLYKQGRKKDALDFMKRADQFRKDYRAAKLRLAEMYFEAKNYKACYKTIYSMKGDRAFFNNKRILDLRLKLAEYAHNRNEAAAVRLILSSNNYNDEDMEKFFSKVTTQGDTSKDA